MIINNLVSLQYFVLMSHLLEVYPEKVAHLNRDAFGRITGSLEFGLRNQARGSLRNCIYCLSYFCLNFQIAAALTAVSY